MNYKTKQNNCKMICYILMIVLLSIAEIVGLGTCIFVIKDLIHDDYKEF
jgi:hypothetical protein